MQFWMRYYDEEKGGLDEMGIHDILESYSVLIFPANGEMHDTWDLSVRFDANQDGLVLKTEMVKLMKWFVREVWVGSSYAEKFVRGSKYLMGDLMKSDRNGDGFLTKDEANDEFTKLSSRLRQPMSSYMNVYYEDYDFNNDGWLDKFELSGLMKRFLRDIL